MESIREKLSWLNPEICPYEIMDKKGYGFEETKPIMVKSVSAEYELIQRLHLIGYRLNNCILKDISREPIEVDGYGIVDHFELLFNVYDEQGMKSKLYDVYFSCYDSENKPYSKTDKIIDYFNIVNCCADFPLPEDFTIKNVNITTKIPIIVN
jgi:hypothetical protein